MVLVGSVMILALILLVGLAITISIYAILHFIKLIKNYEIDDNYYESIKNKYGDKFEKRDESIFSKHLQDDDLLVQKLKYFDINKESSLSDLKKSRNRMLHTYHPDKQITTKEYSSSVNKTIEIIKNYDILKSRMKW